MIILETSNLYLQTIEKENTDILHSMIFSNDDIMKQTFGEKAFTFDETKKFVYNNFCKNNSNIGLASLFEKSSGMLIGLAGVQEIKGSTELGKDKYEFNFIITEEFKNDSYELEIAKALIIFTKKLLKKPSLYSLVHKENNAYKEFITNLGFSFEKEITLKNRGVREVYSKKL